MRSWYLAIPFGFLLCMIENRSSQIIRPLMNEEIEIVSAKVIACGTTQREFKHLSLDLTALRQLQ